MLSYCHGDKASCFPSIRDIMSLSKAARRTIQTHLRYLEMLGYLIITPRVCANGRSTSNEYFLVKLWEIIQDEQAGKNPKSRRKSLIKKHVKEVERAHESYPLGVPFSRPSGVPFSRPQHEAICEAEKQTSNMFCEFESVSVLVGEAAEIGHVHVVLANPTHSNPKPKPAPVESLAPPVPVVSTVHENRPPAQPAPKPAAPTRTVAPQKPAHQAKPAQPQTAPQTKAAQPQPAPAPELTPTASPQAFAPRPAEPQPADRPAPPRPPQKVRTEPAKAFERYEIQGEFNTIETLVRTFHEFVEKGWRVYSEDSFIAWVETWCSVAAKSKPIVPEKKRIRNPKGYLVRLVKEGLDRTVIRQAHVKKAQQIKIDIRAHGLYPSF